MVATLSTDLTHAVPVGEAFEEYQRVHPDQHDPAERQDLQVDRRHGPQYPVGLIPPVRPLAE